ncbi:sensor histidine kinase [Micromonospora sp. RTGN7]|uniref:sensor histidine kinase n=1 Tax=Micromonospora sp. RTGN7 TaxID=3016526 RepID=UPI0029FEEF71|nr:histidine kinase [Micromonospora sp. RTGN7]
MIPLPRRRWRRAGQLAALLGMALLGLVDVGGGYVFLVGGTLALPAAAAQVALAVATAAVWLPAHPQNSRRLAAAAVAVALWSLATTVGYGYLRLTGGQDGRVPLLTAAQMWGLAESCGLLGTAYVVARRAAPLPALVAVAATGLAVTLLPMRAGVDNGHLAIGMGYALLAAGAAAAGTYLRLVANARQRQLAAVRAEQRAEFARDLHDFIAHHVTGIVVQAQGARYVAAQDPERAVLALERIEHAGAETMAAMRRMIGVLRDADAPPDAPMAPLAGVADLPELVEDFTAAGPVRARLHTDGPLDGLPVEVASSAYRVVLEALTNVRRHAAGASRVDVRLHRTPRSLLVRVVDDGSGRRAGRRGFGLAGLTERVEARGGRLRAGPGERGGWVVAAALPLDGGPLPPDALPAEELAAEAWSPETLAARGGQALPVGGDETRSGR